MKPCCLNTRGALDGSVEDSKRKALCQHTDLEVDVGRGWNVHVDSRHRQPNEELLGLDSFQAADGAVFQLSRDVLAVKCQLKIAPKSTKTNIRIRLYKDLLVFSMALVRYEHMPQTDDFATSG